MLFMESRAAARSAPVMAMALVGALIGASGGALAAMDLTTLEAAAKREGSLTYYSAQTASVSEALIKAFKDKYGITLTIFRAPTTALKTRVQSEIDVGRLQADLVGIGEYSVFEINKAKFTPITELPAYATYPDKYKTPLYAVTSIQPALIVVNTQKVKPGEITSWTDILDPKWRGQIAMLSIGSSVSITNNYLMLAQRYGDDFIRKLGAQRPNYQGSSSPAVQLAAAGEAAISFPISVSVLPELEKAGAPIRNVLTAPMTGAQITVGIPASSTKPNAARLLLNLMMTPEGQVMQNGGQLGSSPLPNIPGTFPLPPEYEPPNEQLPAAEVARIRELLGSP